MVSFFCDFIGPKVVVHWCWLLASNKRPQWYEFQMNNMCQCTSLVGGSVLVAVKEMVEIC